jgi:AcrR family transcriptional regulator
MSPMAALSALKAQGGGRKASKEVRRQQLIEATIDSLAKRGYAETTLADVADGAGLSRGIVNFHFDSKEKLLVESLRYLADEYGNHWRAALAKAGPSPAERLWALVAADFDRKVCSRRKIAAWCAFWGEAESRPTYQALCGSRDEQYQETIVDLCKALVAEGGYDADPVHLAHGLDALLEGLWLRLLMDPAKQARERLRACAAAHLAAVFPRHFSAEGPIGSR